MNQRLVLTPLEHRGSAVDECGETLCRILSGEEDGQGIDGVDRLVAIYSASDELFPHGDRDWRLGGNSVREFYCRGKQLISWHDSLNHAQTQRLVGTYALTSEYHEFRPLTADDGGGA